MRTTKKGNAPMSDRQPSYLNSVSALLGELRTISDVPDGLSEANYAYRLGYVHGIAKIAAATLGNAINDGDENGDESWRRKGL